MRKERNNFFDAQSYSQNYLYSNNMIPPMPQMEASSSFYMNQNMNNNDYNLRISRLERQVSRLESRINKLENDKEISKSDDIDINTNMYMI